MNKEKKKSNSFRRVYVLVFMATIAIVSVNLMYGFYVDTNFRLSGQFPFLSQIALEYEHGRTIENERNGNYDDDGDDDRNMVLDAIINTASDASKKDEDYCSEDGKVCAFHNICYNTSDQSWHTSSDPMTTTTGDDNGNPYPLLNDMNYTKRSDSRKEPASHCNEHFTPRPNVPYPSDDEMIYEEGTTYFVCCWVNHFGHILIQMMVSAVHALDKIGLGDFLKSHKMNFLVDNRASKIGSKEAAINVFQFLTGGRPNGVMSLQELKAEAENYQKNNVCFEKLVVGMLYDDLVHGGVGRSTPPGAEVGMLELLRDHVDKLYPLTKESSFSAFNETKFSTSGDDNEDEGEEEDDDDEDEVGSSNNSNSNSMSMSMSMSTTENIFRDSPPECTITFLRRKYINRVISNFDEVMNATKQIFHEDKWNIRTVSFDGPSMEAQYLTVRSSMVFISVSGTGSHMGLFLPDGGKSVEILFNTAGNVKNKLICEVLPSMTCHSANSKCHEVDSKKCKKALNTEVDIDSFRETIETVKVDISDLCDDAMNSFTKSE